MSKIRPFVVRFDYTEYESNHGRAPRGRGSWGFVDAKHANSPDYLKFVYWAPAGTFTEAKRAAAVHYATAVADFSGTVVVCS